MDFNQLDDQEGLSPRDFITPGHPDLFDDDPFGPPEDDEEYGFDDPDDDDGWWLTETDSFEEDHDDG